MREISPETLTDSVEVGGPKLADDLDRWFTRVDPEWVARPDHVSQSIRIVEIFYLEAMRLEEPDEARVRTEQWSRQRNERLVAAVLDIQGGYAPASRSDLCVWLRRRSNARREQRLGVFDVERAALVESLDRSRQVTPGNRLAHVTVLVGGFGSGKSEIAENWHQDRIEAFASGDSNAVPVWLHADELGKEGIEDRLARLVGSQRLHEGVAVVVDGLDEVGGVNAERILRDAKVHVASNPLCSILITTRPGTLPTGAPFIDAPLLDDSQAASLIDEIVGRANVSREWSTALRESIRYPFFLLAAASIIRAGDTFSSEAELLSKMANLALRRPSASEAFSSAEAFALLKRLAVATTEGHPNDVQLDERERRVLIATRIITQLADDSVTFNLPIFRQWFASQALLHDRDVFQLSIASASAFGRWRWVLVIAVSEVNVSRMDDVLTQVLKFNPGAGSWLLSRVERAREARGAAPESESLAEERLIRAGRAWINSIGGLAPWVIPAFNLGQSVHVSVAHVADHLAFRWSRSNTSEDTVLRLPSPSALAGSPRIGPTVRTDRSTDLWPWTSLRRLVIAGMRTPLATRAPIAKDGTGWNSELRYEAGRRVAANPSLRHPPLDANAILETARSAIAQSPKAASYGFDLTGRPVAPSQLQHLVDWIESTGASAIERPVASPDLQTPRSHGSDGFFSAELLVKFCADVWGLACQVYDELVDDRFSAFGWGLSHSATGRFCIVGDVAMSQQPDGGFTTVHYTELPEELWKAKLAADPTYVVSANSRAAFRLDEERSPLVNEAREADWAAAERWSEGKEVGPFWTLSDVSMVLRVDEDRPASDIAIKWLTDDLRRISLAPARR